MHNICFSISNFFIKIAELHATRLYNFAVSSRLHNPYRYIQVIICDPFWRNDTYASRIAQSFADTFGTRAKNTWSSIHSSLLFWN